MSYIRCLSNPEGLYAWSDGRTVNISHGVKKPHSSGRSFTIPQGVFDGLLKKWANWTEPAMVRGAVAEELHVDEKTGRVIPEWKPCGRGCKPVGKNGFIPCRRCARKQHKDVRRGRFVVRLSYRSDFVDLWRVTWDYMTRRSEPGTAARHTKKPRGQRDRRRRRKGEATFHLPRRRSSERPSGRP